MGLKFPVQSSLHFSAAVSVSFLPNAGRLRSSRKVIVTPSPSASLRRGSRSFQTNDRVFDDGGSLLVKTSLYGGKHSPEEKACSSVRDLPLKHTEFSLSKTVSFTRSVGGVSRRAHL